MKTEMDKGFGFGQFLWKPITGVVLVLAREGIDGLGIAFELARRVVETGNSARLRIWSWQSFLSLAGVSLTGDSYTPGHRWTLPRDMLLESDAESKPAWMQDLLKDWDEKERRDEMKTNEWTLGEIKRTVCVRFDMPEYVFDGSKRFASEPRCMAAYLARKFTSKPLFEL